MKNYRLYLIRHGITQGNLEGRYVGAGTDEPLCEEGEKRLGELRTLFRYPQVKTVFASPLLRAVQTADVLFPDADNKLVLDILRENHFGEFEGKTLADLSENANFSKWLTASEHYTPIGGESAEAFHARCKDAFLKLFEYMMKAGIEQAACVTHGGVIMSMMAQCAVPKRAPELWTADPGCGYSVLSSAELWMRDQLGEAKDILPFGYLGD